MASTRFSRILIAIAITLFFVGSTVSGPADLASGYSTGAYSADTFASAADDTFSSADLSFWPQAISFVALAALMVLVGLHPRPAVQSYSISYPVLPQGPPTRH
ncbi:hypothetical protein [Marinobacter fonticola]|uniref:hypothetical protein n=1 Tax=Marinobacter fonticola TaxID=2603215 RepID=UPI0011E6969B|nr:hypothetical protein [Marinobacter fonticola]